MDGLRQSARTSRKTETDVEINQNRGYGDDCSLFRKERWKVYGAWQGRKFFAGLHYLGIGSGYTNSIHILPMIEIYPSCKIVFFGWLLFRWRWGWNKEDKRR
jgi:hypothetical protein